jgi:hypothetical protein
MTDTPTAFFWTACYAASVSAWAHGDAHGPGACARCSHVAHTKRRLRRSKCARPNISLQHFQAVDVPLHGAATPGQVTPALTAA